MTTGAKKPKKKPTSFIPRALEELRQDGWQAIEKVERWQSFTNKKTGKAKGWKNDLYGAIDILACSPGRGFLGVQVTSWSHALDRARKAIADERMVAFMKAPARMEVWGYRVDEDGAIEKRVEVLEAS